MTHARIVFLALALTLVVSAALAETVTNENGYEVRRSETVVPVPHGRIGRKTIDRETRAGVTEDTDGNSSNFTMTLGGFMHRCPVPDDDSDKFVVSGDFEYSIVVDIVNTDVVPTKRERYEKRVNAKIKVFVNDNLSITEGEVVGEYSAHVEGVRTEPTPIRKRYPIRAYGMPDFDALRDITKATGDLATAALLWNSSTTVLELQKILLEANICTEVTFDPSSESRTVGPNETVEVTAKYRMLQGQRPVPRGTWEAIVGNGKVAEPKGTVPADGSFVVRYTATSKPNAGDGFHVLGISPAGVAEQHWKIRTGLTLAVEHRIVSRRDTPHAIVGRPLYDGTVRFEIDLEPFPTLPGEFRGETTVVREFSVGHITPRCAGQGSQTEYWRVNATVDAASGTMKLRLSMDSEELDAFWICDGQRSEVTSRFRDALKLWETPLTMPSRSGSRQTFTPTGPLFQETLTVSVP